MVGLAPPPNGWADAIGQVADQFMNARVCFYRGDGDDDYDVLSGEGDRGGIDIIWAGRARVQQLRTPQAFATNYDSSTTRAFRFQISKTAGVPFLSEGVKARVLDAGVSGDQDLQELVYVVNSAINASHQAVRTVELSANMQREIWTWSLDESGEVVYA